MDDKKIIEQLNELTKDTNVPEKLMPENILDTIKQVDNKKKTVSFSDFIKQGTTRKVAGFVSAAAILVVAVFAFDNISKSNQENTTEMMLNIENVSDASEVSPDENRMMEMASEESNEIAKTGNISSYDEVYEELEKYKIPEPTLWEKLFGGRKYYYAVEESVMETDAATDAAMGATNGLALKQESSFDGVSTDSEAGGYSKTNVQMIGIDEADIIKTDGKYIYYASCDLHMVTIYEANGEKTEAVNSIYIEKIGRLDEIYVDNDTLIATGGSYRDNKYQVELVKYDITDRKNCKFVGIFTQEGNSIETRKIGDIVYVVTEVNRNVNVMKKDKPETYIPRVCDDLIDVIDIFIPEETEGSAYTVISSVDVSGKMEKIDSAAVLGFNGTFYMGNENMYLYRTKYTSYDDYRYGGEPFTEVRKIDYVSEDGQIGAITSGKVPGVIKDTFAVNEYKGYLRMMTTSYPNNGGNSASINNVFIMDSDLKVVGSIEGLAEGERIYSARYMGDTAYFVTYKETDPLYSVDLKDPESPKIMGALKIPGFSEYLHAYGDGLLLGIGIEQVNTKNGWREDYIKLSMFDISNPYDVSEEDKNILSDANYADALYDYKAVMIDPEKNIFGFITQSYYEVNPVYRVFTYQDGKFVEIISHKLESYKYDYTRSVYIGDYVYIVNENDLVAYSIKGKCGNK